MTVGASPRERLMRAYGQLHAWLLNHVYPRWSIDGVDVGSGGFVESIERDGTRVAQPLRLRVQARQVYAFGQAQRLGWHGDARPIMRRGLDQLAARYQRSDGLFRTLIGASGQILDDRALLYDQAFVLLAYAAAAGVLGEAGEWEALARRLRGHIGRHLRAADGAFFSDAEHSPHWESNPHMHLLEACLAWESIGADPDWHTWAGDIIELAHRRFLRTDVGLLGEAFSRTWQPAPGLAGRIIEPGHQFEWAWLLLRAMARHGEALQPIALALIGQAERFGVRNGVAVNALLDDLTLHDPGARLWPQTERLKAMLGAAGMTEPARYGMLACAAAESLLPYLNPDAPGLWFDLQRPDGCVQPSAAPASTLYHLVGAIVELHRALADPA